MIKNIFLPFFIALSISAAEMFVYGQTILNAYTPVQPANNTNTKESPSSQNEGKENDLTLSLDGQALNLLLPDSNKNERAQIDNSKKPLPKEDKNPVRKKKSKKNKKERDEHEKALLEENKTVIPKMSPVKWIYDITGDEKPGRVFFPSGGKSRKAGENGGKKEKEGKCSTRNFYCPICCLPICGGPAAASSNGNCCLYFMIAPGGGVVLRR